VAFERCGDAAKGSVVLGADVANDQRSLDYLVRVGAIVPLGDVDQGDESDAHIEGEPARFAERMAAARAAKRAAAGLETGA
jgi:hypothetical protein